MENKYKETLEKQLQLLSERSEREPQSVVLAQITYAMCEVVKLLNQDCQVDTYNALSNAYRECETRKKRAEELLGKDF